MGEQSAADRPLSGIRVLDFTRVVAGPLATRILADQGAEVIKVEPPEGDMTRTFPPLREGGITPYFAHQNAGKRFCSVDLAADGATDLLLRLVAECDVLVENYRPGVMARFGLGPDELCARFPKLVYCSITGFGQDGPWAGRRAYAPIGHLESGFLAYDRQKLGRTSEQPAMVLGDVSAAVAAASSINAMLVKATRTGRGGPLDVSMIESMVYLMEWVSTELAGGAQGTNAGAADECPILHLPDGRIWGIAGNPVAWFDHLIIAMDRPDLAADPRFADPLDREENKDSLVELLLEWASTFDNFDDFRLRLETSSPFTTAELRTITELADSEFAQHRDLFQNIGDGLTVPARSASGSGIGTDGYLAARGADNESVLSDVLGIQEAEYANLVKAGVMTAA
ncbi:MAG: CaiB/BaiF CoA transferase family protein [Acidimicrobiales bacterium]|jgi:crotonobetainyl-CoA:carnitine CoA-transferase CaiB-like acyl-CoA transferase